MPNLPKQPKPTDERAIRHAWDLERSAARRARVAGDTAGEWHHLERAHILSQPLPLAHVRTHVAMLATGLRRRDRREVIGQFVRVIVAGPGSVTRRYPLGNTGGAYVDAVAPMPIPSDLRSVLAVDERPGSDVRHGLTCTATAPLDDKEPAHKTARTITMTLAAVALALALAAAACGGPSNRAAAAPTTTTVPPSTTTTIASPTTTAVDRPTESFDELVTVSTGRLHVRCAGAGDRTVLLIAGWGRGSEDWSAVEPAIAARTRVCSYDRFGTGTSDKPRADQTFETQVADLHELLDTIGEPGPFVVVGHSFGGAEAVTFASTYPDEVDGLMLVDASPIGWPDTVCSVPAYAGGCDLLRDPTKHAERLDAFPAFEQVAAITTLGDLPITILTAAHRSSDGLTPSEVTRLEGIWSNGMERWTQLSTGSKLFSVDDTGHAIQSDQPTVVIRELRKLLP